MAPNGRAILRLPLLLAAALVLLVASDAGGSSVPGLIAAVEIEPHGSPNANLVLFSPIGSSPRRLIRSATRHPAWRGLASPAWSPDGRQVYLTGVLAEHDATAFTYFDVDVFVVDAGSGRLRRLTATLDASTPIPSPDGRTLAFARAVRPSSVRPTIELWLMRADGSGRRRLLPEQKGRVDVPGSWSPDGRRLAFVRARPGAPPAIYELDLETRAVRLLAERAVAPAYSPDGERLAFVSDRDRNGKVDAGENGDSSAAELYVANADGSDPHRLTKTVNLDERTPSWSPDGSQLVYARQGPARFTEQLMVIDADGRNAERIAGNAASNAQGSFRQPAWRP